jgi:hypothetical protein
MATDSQKQHIRDAAAGRWPDILASVGNIPRNILDGRHHPCPKCGGDDRFRLVDEAAGAVLCNQCFVKNNGDGFAALQWSLNIKFGEALKLVADYCGVKLKSKKSSKDIDPAKDLEFKPWSSQLCQFFLKSKSGVTEQSVLDAGGQMARYKRQYSVIAFPVIGESLDTEKPVGWVLVNAMGGTLPKWDKTGKVVGQVKVKLAYGSQPGLIGTSAIDRLKTEGMIDRVIKCEGISDSLAVAAILPGDSRTVAITNSNGAQEKPFWRAGFLANFETVMLHDADQPGVSGAGAWAVEIAKANGKASIAKLPYEVEKDHGKDVRDWLAEGHGWQSLQQLIDAAEPVSVERDASGNVVADEKTDTHFEQEICRALQIEVLGENSQGHIRLFSLFHRKAVTIHDISRLGFERLLQICGPPAKAKVHKSNEDIEGSYKFSEVKEAIGTVAGYRIIDDHGNVGAGIWAGRDLKDNETGSIVLVNNNEAARYNGDQVLRQVIAPRIDGLILDLEGGEPWFDRELLSQHLEAVKSGTAFAEAAIAEAEELFRRWKWRSPDTDPTLVVGLVLASWVQTVWRWRPQVSVTGESNSGKSYLFQAIGGHEGDPGLFSTLAYKQAKSTEAGIRQGIGNSARIIMCDEFEQSKDRNKVLELIRTSSRGEKISRGTAGQKALMFGLQHICWVAATETGLIRQPDRNRFVSLDLEKADPSQAGKLVLPPSRVLYSLGQRLLAIALHHALAARELAVLLKDTKRQGVDPRQVESYAVPASILSKAVGYDFEQAKSLLYEMLGGIETGDNEESDHENLLSDILMGQVNTRDKGTLTVGQIMESSAEYHDKAALVESHGLRLIDGSELFVACNAVSQGLLKHTGWNGQRIDKVLLRIDGAKRGACRMGGRSIRGVFVPVDFRCATDTPGATASATDY